MITIYGKNKSVLILRAGQPGALIKYTSRLEGNNIVSNRTSLIHTSNKYWCKYNRVVLVLSGKPISKHYTIITSLMNALLPFTDICFRNGPLRRQPGTRWYPVRHSTAVPGLLYGKITEPGIFPEIIFRLELVLEQLCKVSHIFTRCCLEKI